jgi:hypothetical protein
MVAKKFKKLKKKTRFNVKNDSLSISQSINDYNMRTIAERVLNQIYPH